jgi:hypothetical protein
MTASENENEHAATGESDPEATTDLGPQGSAAGGGDDGSKRAEGAKGAAHDLDKVLYAFSRVPLWLRVVVAVAAIGAVGPWFGDVESGFPGAILNVWLLIWLGRVVLLAVILVAVALAYFVTRSILTRALRQEWGWKAPWLETETKSMADLQTALGEVDKLQGGTERAEQKILDLSAQLGEATAEIKSKDRELEYLKAWAAPFEEEVGALVAKPKG